LSIHFKKILNKKILGKIWNIKKYKKIYWNKELFMISYFGNDK